LRTDKTAARRKRGESTGCRMELCRPVQVPSIAQDTFDTESMTTGEGIRDQWPLGSTLNKTGIAAGALRAEIAGIREGRHATDLASLSYQLTDRLVCARRTAWSSLLSLLSSRCWFISQHACQPLCQTRLRARFNSNCLSAAPDRPAGASMESTDASRLSIHSSPTPLAVPLCPR
jgi:hypothetical protein